MIQNSAPERGIKTAVRVFDIIQLIEELDEPTFTDLTEHVEMADSSLYDYLVTLEHVGYITKQDGVYRLALRFFEHGVIAKDELPVLSQAQSVLEQTAKESGATVWLQVEENGKSVYVAREVGEHAIETHAHLGKHDHMHSLAGGKAILSQLPEERVLEIIDEHGLPARTPYTITSKDELLDELDEVREQGYALNERETAEGAWAIGAPIVVDGTVHGSIALPEPIARMKSDEHRQELIDLVTSASNEIELKMTFE